MNDEFHDKAKELALAIWNLPGGPYIDEAGICLIAEALRQAAKR